MRAQCALGYVLCALVGFLFFLLSLTVTSRGGYFPISQRREKLREIMLLARVLTMHDGVWVLEQAFWLYCLFSVFV